MVSHLNFLSSHIKYSMLQKSVGSGASADESLKYLVVSQCGQNSGCESEKLKDKVALESIWNRALEISRVCVGQYGIEL